MKGKFSFAIFGSFVLGYTIAENLIQPNLWFPQLLRHHLSDFFAGPSFMAIAVIGFIINKPFLKYYGHFISFSICVIFELIMSPDYIDIFAYILGLTTYIFLTSKFNDE